MKLLNKYKTLLINYIISYKNTLFSKVMMAFILVHTSEDILLMSIGRFAPLPLFAMYGLGLLISWLIMGCIVERLLGKLNKK